MDVHGGDVYRNHVNIDFSINVNPFGIPESVKTALHKAVEMCDIYPDMKAEKLKKAVGEFLAVPEEYLLFGNGASELFMAIVHSIRPKKIVIPVPSFYGYEYAAKAVDSEIIYYEMKKENNFCMTGEIDNILTNDIDILFLANPNNPVGNLLSKESLKGLLKHCESRGIYVVLDECFIEFSGERFSMVPEIEEFPHLILVRAFTKIFAIPGVRLGYLVCKSKTVLAKISGQLPEWNISCFAQEAGCICSKQTEFIMKTEIFIKKEREFMEKELGRKGFKIFPSMANFIMIYSEAALYERLLERGILIRDCSNFRGLGKGFYRVTVKHREENEILLKNL